MKIEAADIFANISTLKKYFLFIFYVLKWKAFENSRASWDSNPPLGVILISVSSAAVIRLLNQITWKEERLCSINSTDLNEVRE